MHQGGHVISPEGAVLDLVRAAHLGLPVVVVEGGVQDDVFPAPVGMEGPVPQPPLLPRLRVRVSEITQTGAESRLQIHSV